MRPRELTGPDKRQNRLPEPERGAELYQDRVRGSDRNKQFAASRRGGSLRLRAWSLHAAAAANWSSRCRSAPPAATRSNLFSPLPFAPTTPPLIPAVITQLSPVNKVWSPIFQVTSSNSISRLVLRSVAEKSICAVPLRLLALRSASSPINSPALSIRAFDFLVRAFAPRQSNSISL